LAAATEHALHEAGVTSVERTGHCTACEPELFFSHRRDRGRTGRQGVIAYIG
jgi:polyphenol oxidase